MAWTCIFTGMSVSFIEAFPSNIFVLLSLSLSVWNLSVRLWICDCDLSDYIIILELETQAFNKNMKMPRSFKFRIYIRKKKKLMVDSCVGELYTFLAPFFFCLLLTFLLVGTILILVNKANKIMSIYCLFVFIKLYLSWWFWNLEHNYGKFGQKCIGAKHKVSRPERYWVPTTWRLLNERLQD